ncbi:hypothetical protein BGZ60DRAFT_533087 [Tricladium varicosporioides]|nr:hypothetical protein BGZ60DRAFT_533087 [Hymenoscyphus varicosporioides]
MTEAIVLCCRLEIRYLYACILQVDNLDKQDQICIMDVIYLGAHFTIVSACGVKSRGGLPGVRRGSRPIQRREIAGNITLVVAQPELGPALQGALWQTRAWTFQKATLSSRLLIFTNSGVFFRCSQELWHEDVQLELLPQHGKKVTNIEIEASTCPFWKDVISSDMDYCGYAQLIAHYTPRAMTNQSDGLNAFIGLTKALITPLGTDFFQGLPINTSTAPSTLHLDPSRKNVVGLDFQAGVGVVRSQ